METRNRILLAEDEVDTLLGLQKTLVKEGYAVDVAKDGLEAAEKVRAQPFDVVVSDLKMPRIDGMELLHMTKETNRNIVFIIITGYGTVDSAVEAMRLGAADYINKPFTPKILIGAIEKALGKEEDKVEVREQVPKPVISAVHHTRLGNSWFSVQPDGSVLIGADEKFYEEAGEVVYCDLPFEGDRVTKGQRCVRMINAGKHMPKKFICPLSGTVVRVNEKMETQPWVAQKDPLGDGWLFAIVPSRLEEELNDVPEKTV
jgi:CheY-like chemotaxis protein/glycine cleavage system H lipoate-binding protein